MPTPPFRFPRTEAVIQTGIDRGLHFGVQIYVSQQGRVLLDAGYGDARPNVAMTTATIMPWLSAGKPLTAVASLMLVERGLLTLDTRIAAVIPEFGVGNKDSITLRHVLTHTGGFRNASLNWPHSSWTENIDAVCATSLEPGWVVGETAGYHIASSWYVLGELIRRLDGRAPSDFLRAEIFEPLQMTSSWNGMPCDVWQSYGDRIGRMWNRERGTISALPWDDARHCQECSPGGNSRGPIRELGHFYECLLQLGAHCRTRLLSHNTIDEMTTPQRVGCFDQTLQHVTDFGLGFMVNSNQYGPTTVPYGFGVAASNRAFGHGGSQSSMAFADPEHGLVVAYVANIRPGEAHHQRRHHELIAAIWSDIAEI